MPNFGTRLAGAWGPALKDTLLSTQFNNPSAPADVQQLGNVFGSLLNRGSMEFKDDTGSVNLNPMTGQFGVMGNNFGLNVGVNDPSIEARFRFGAKPQVMQQSNAILGPGGDTYDVVSPLSPAQQLREETIYNYQQSNPQWYRP
jgi:hypothetical protein